MSKPKIKITLVDKIGTCGCHRGHKIGDTFDYDTDRGKLCPMAIAQEKYEHQNAGFSMCWSAPPGGLASGLLGKDEVTSSNLGSSSMKAEA